MIVVISLVCGIFVIVGVVESWVVVEMFVLLFLKVLDVFCVCELNVVDKNGVICVKIGVLLVFVVIDGW